MPKELYSSSYECDCGHRSHFAEDTVREVKETSHRKPVLLGDDDEKHMIVFKNGMMSEILCPNITHSSGTTKLTSSGRKSILSRAKGSKPVAPPPIDVKSNRNRRVWLYMVDGRNSEDLAILDSQGFDRWRGNPLTKAGDLIVMYRSAPFSDIAYVFIAASDAWRTPISHDWPWKWAVEIADGFRLQRVIRLDELKRNPALKHWDFLNNQRGATSRRSDLQEQGVWPALQRMLTDHVPGLPAHFRLAWTGRGARNTVFLSYASDDRRKVQDLYVWLARNGIDVWLDRHELQPAEDWDRTITGAIRSSKAVIVCLSKSWLRRDKNSYVKKEFQIAASEAIQRRNQFLFPVLIESCRIPETLAYQASRLTGRNRAANMKQFMLSIRRAVST